jgi:hypothetical protein
VELAVYGSNQDDIEDLERIVVGCRVSAWWEEVEAVDAIFTGTEITAESDGLCESGSSEDEKDGQERKGEKECGGHRVISVLL